MSLSDDLQPTTNDLVDEQNFKLDNDARTWITQEHVLTIAVEQLESEVFFLRDMLRLALEKEVSSG